MAENLIPPTPIAVPFAQNGDRNTLPAEHQDGSSRASLDVGFPPVTAVPVAEGGVPPTRADFNALGHLFTSNAYYMQNGGTFTFDQNVANLIGGYPMNARLWGKDAKGKGFVVRSIKASNFDNFAIQPAYIGNTEGQINTADGKQYHVSWVHDIITQAYVDETAANLALSNINTLPAETGKISKGPDVVVESFIQDDGKYWYRLYKSGWLEQGGIFEKNTGTYKLILPIPYKKRICSIIGTVYNAIPYDRDSQSNAAGPNGSSLSEIMITTDYHIPTCWEVKGY